jgi:uncharacterized protein (UPF0333 family)
MLNFQNYRKYRLPITINPLEYGKLIYHNTNIYIMHINIRSLALITKFDTHNQVKLYSNGDLIFEYKDHKIDDNSFVRSIEGNKFTFNNNKLINKIILVLTIIALTYFIISEENSLNIAMAALSSKNIIKLRKVKSKNI